MSNLTVGDWLAFATLMFALFAGLVTTIKSLMNEQWKDHKELHRDIKDDLDLLKNDSGEFKQRLTAVETVQKMRQTRGGA